MSGHHHALPPRDRYALRNDPSAEFHIRSGCQAEGAGGGVARALVRRHDGLEFRYEVIFRGDYSASKANFTRDMYWETALSVVRSQLESHVHRDTRITLEANSGLPLTEVGVVMSWEAPEIEGGTPS